MVVNVQNWHNSSHELALDLDAEQKLPSKTMEQVCNCPKCGFQFLKKIKKSKKDD